MTFWQFANESPWLTFFLTLTVCSVPVAGFKALRRRWTKPKVEIAVTSNGSGADIAKAVKEELAKIQAEAAR